MLCRHLGGPHPSPNLEQNVLMLSHNSPMCGCHIVMLGDMMDGFLGGDGNLEIRWQPMKHGKAASGCGACRKHLPPDRWPWPALACRHMVLMVEVVVVVWLPPKMVFARAGRETHISLSRIRASVFLHAVVRSALLNAGLVPHWSMHVAQ